MTRPTTDALLLEFEGRGVFVREVPMPAGWRGAYHLPSRTAYVREGLAEWQAVPTLMHELEHVRREDDGHQCRRVERRIDDGVAVALVDVESLRVAERAVGCHLGALAAELGVPVWVLEARRRTLDLAA
ncbi:hypothetical protein [Actinomyces radicidentis]|uniref:hypothetical protein n=1 Tax=Actinomyces radicidentis TaxID=111015 RepID=UPI0028EB9F38|nr:hypothetical protein [Actinomyces radicidentis]